MLELVNLCVDEHQEQAVYDEHAFKPTVLTVG
jgi:hypothetical protein